MSRTDTEPLLYILCACQVPVHAELQVPILGSDRVPDGEGEQQQQRRVPWVLIPPPPHAPDPPTQPGEETAQRWAAAPRLARTQLNRWAHGPSTVYLILLNTFISIFNNFHSLRQIASSW